jgi:hypothetical protein
VRDWVNDLWTGWKARDDLSHASATAEECSVGGDTIRADDIVRLLPGPYYMDPPDGGDVSLLEQLRRMAKDAELYRAMRNAEGTIGVGIWLEHDDGTVNRRGWLIGEEADQAIDQAIAAKRGDKP